MKKKILVTGGAGFIGSHVVDILIENNYEVVVVDNLSSGNVKNINPKSRFYKIDICDKAKLNEVFEKEKPAFCNHHAAQINVRKSVKEPVHDATQNVIGTLNILECCKKFNIKKIVYASSGGACYGEPEYLPCDESHPIKPICHYGVSKHAVEHYFYLYNKLYGIDYTILRYGNVYGPRQDPLGEAGVVAIFIGLLAKNKQCMIFGDGTQTRDFVYVKDVAKANLLALENNAKSKIFNIGTGQAIDINEIYTSLKNIFDSKLLPIYSEPIPGEIKHVFLDYKKAEDQLGWKAKTNLNKGLTATVQWFKLQSVKFLK